MGDSARIAEQFGARVAVLPRNLGPAACRNYAALLTQSEILIFLDADTCFHTDTLELMERHLKEDSSLSAVIGSYDDTPSDPGICSQYRNLAHCYVHRSAHRSALTGNLAWKTSNWATECRIAARISFSIRRFA